jgi:two-component system chemotaxis sensor kinase CheA
MEGLAGLLVTKFRLARAVEELAKRGVDVRDLRQITHEAARQLRDMRGAILGLRMVSLHEMFERLPILVRGLRTATGKTVQLSMNVGRVEVDKGVGERLWPVLVHLIRNAVDHGIESDTERLRLGKSAEGKLSVSVVQSQSSHVELVIEDDGAGMDAERVARRAGKAVPDDDAGLLDLITAPGFSTRDVANATSGRGMGLDIVRRTIVQELGGELKLSTRKNVGTRFTLKVPITIALVDTFRFESDTQQFLVPVASVEELIDVDAKDVIHGPGSKLARIPVVTLERRGYTMPLVELSAMLGTASRGLSPKAIIVRRNEQFFAFGVDRLIDHHEVVVRPLVDPLVSVPGITGSTDLGDGRPTLLLDLVALANKLSALSGRAA